ncbi:MAG TPA: hypothetical protein VG708_09115, partial [Mycobacteriales bacterium]|nr:hypothetical protein [Mycobacteriales bacterium]
MNVSPGQTVHVTGTASGFSAQPTVNFTSSGADNIASTACTVGGAGPWTFDCSYTASGTTGVDNVTVTGSHTGDTSDTDNATVFINAAANQIALSPPSQTTAASNCANYTVRPSDSGGHFLANYPITVQVVMPNTTATQTLTTCGSGPISGVHDTISGGNETLRFVVTTNADASATSFGFTSSVAGTAAVSAYDNGVDSNVGPSGTFESATQTFTAGGAGGVAVTPGSVTQVTGTQATYTVTVTNGSGQTLSGQSVREDVTSGPDMTPSNVVPSVCGTTNGSGVATCTLTNGGTAGTDQITFYVESNGTPGPQSGEAQGTATAIFQAAPTFTGITLKCSTPGGTASNACTVPLSQHSVTFTANVVNGTAPVQGAPVTFTVTGGPPASVSPTTGSATTDASGNATFTVTDSSPTAGEVLHVSAAIGASAPATATATFANPAPTTMTVTPTTESVTEGGSPSFAVKVTDQFGNGIAGDVITASNLVGRNTGKTINSAT